MSAVRERAPDSLEALLDARYSCRGFLPRPVPRETIEKIAAIAQRTASWCNSQPWQTLVVSGEAADRFRGALYEHAATNESAPDFPFPREYKGVYLARRRECGFSLYEAVGVKRGDREAGTRQTMENFRLFGAPHVALITTDEALGVYGAIDCGAYVGNFMLAAQSLGVSTIPQAALARHAKFTREHFGIPADRLLVCGISFGYENPDHPANKFRTTRAKISEALEFRD